MSVEKRTLIEIIVFVKPQTENLLYGMVRKRLSRCSKLIDYIFLLLD